MKLLLIASFVMLIVSNFCLAREGAGSSGGSDPLEILATPYPQTEQLDSAIEFILKKVKTTDLPQDLKSKIEDEMTLLRTGNKFRSLPAILILGNNGGPEGYSLPHDQDKFLSLGAMTWFYPNASIYLSDRVKEYDQSKFSDLILHEVLHHILPTSLRADESFVASFTISILQESVSQNELRALELGAYYRSTFISGEAFSKSPELKKIKSVYVRDKYSEGEYETFIRSKIPYNLSDWSVIDVYATILHLLKINPHLFLMTEASVEVSLRHRMLELIKRINPSANLKEGYSFGCKKNVGYFGTCDVKNRVMMREVFILR